VLIDKIIMFLSVVSLFIFLPMRLSKRRIDEWDNLIDGDVTDWQDHFYVQSVKAEEERVKIQNEKKASLPNKKA